MTKDFETIIQNAQSLLSGKEWVRSYESYAKKMLENSDFIKEKRGSFREWEPLFFYINTTKAMAAHSTLTLDVRYMGQTVAVLSCDKNDRVTLHTTPKMIETNLRDFDCAIPLDHVDWKDATEFRKHFRDRAMTRNAGKKGNVEHHIESMLISEFEKAGGSKLLRGIQPVKLASRIRFAMPTVLSASNHSELKVAQNGKGGGIDILARVGSGGSHTRLCVIEVKDENTAKEPPEAALQQAVEYAVFVRELLRSDAGQDWWELFGFGGEIPDTLTLYAACAMPPSQAQDDESGKGMRLGIDGDIIECHSIYFELAEDNRSFRSIKTSLPPTK